MKNIKIIDKLGFKINKNNDFGKECESVIEFLLNKFIIDDNYNCYFVINNGLIDHNKKKNVSRGFCYDNESFDFIVIIDNKTQDEELIIRPTLQKHFNDNNFVLFTTKSSTRNIAISKFLDLGCINAVNLDGGGSVALLFKAKDSNTINVVTGNGRSLPEVGYFVEQ